MNNITDSIKISKGIKKITLEILPEDILLQSVEYVKVGEKESIVDRLSQKVLVPLEENTYNPRVIRISQDPGVKEQIFHITSPGQSDASVYIVTENGSIKKTSHLMIVFEDGPMQILYSESTESYKNILRFILSLHRDKVDGLMVKYEGTYYPFEDVVVKICE